MRTVVVSVGPLATAVANNIATSQSVGAGASVTINGSLASGGVATLDKPRRVLITSAGNNSADLFTITGTNWSGSTISEVLTGANAGTAQSVLDYATVTKIVSASATASTITVGTSGVASSAWVRLSEYSMPNVAMQVDVTGTVNATVQSSLDDPNDPTNPVTPASMTWIASGDTAVVGLTGSVQSSFAVAPRWVRLLLNSGSGSATFTVYQTAWSVGYG